MDRFWTKVEKSSDCWEWQGGRSKNGYGAFWLDGRQALAHRVAYELVVGSIPKGLDIDHLCRNRGCVNPVHLEPVTRQTNLLRGSRVKPHCPHGHPFDEENTYHPPSNPTSRQCRTCWRKPWRN